MSAPIRRQVRVRCSQAHAFAVFTGRTDLWWPPSHRQLRGSQIRMEEGVGGRFYERTEGGDERRLGEVTRWEPPHRVTYTWYPGSVTGPTEVDVRFSRDGEQTVVDVIHAEGDSRLGAAWSQHAQKYRNAWAEVLPALTRFIAEQPDAFEA